MLAYLELQYFDLGLKIIVLLLEIFLQITAPLLFVSIFRLDC